jgi:hypothetical protein
MSRGHWASSLIWGRNKDLDVTPRIFNAYTLESTLRFIDRNWIWGRIENVDRDRTLLFGETPEAVDVEEEPIGRVQAFTLGYARDLGSMTSWLNPALGFQFTVHGMPGRLKPIYGNQPTGFAVFLRLRPRGQVHTSQMSH